MEKLGDVLKVIIDNFGYLFGIDFLSLFVSGATCLGAFAFVWIQLAHRTVPSELTQGAGIAIMVLACYVLGMICFAFGRGVRMTIFEQSQKRVRRLMGSKKSLTRSPEFFLAVLEDHALSKQEFVRKYLYHDDMDKPSLTEIADQARFEDGEIRSSSFSRQYQLDKRSNLAKRLNDKDPTGRLYNRLWAEVRQSPHLTASYTLLNRYWFMAATYDGLATALIVWFIVVVVWFLGLWGINPKLNAFTSITLGGMLLLLATTCWREADRYRQYQVEELVATLAYQKSKLESDEESLYEH